MNCFSSHRRSCFSNLRSLSLSLLSSLELLAGAGGHWRAAPGGWRGGSPARGSRWAGPSSPSLSWCAIVSRSSWRARDLAGARPPVAGGGAGSRRRVPPGRQAPHLHPSPSARRLTGAQALVQLRWQQLQASRSGTGTCASEVSGDPESRQGGRRP